MAQLVDLLLENEELLHGFRISGKTSILKASLEPTTVGENVRPTLDIRCHHAIVLGNLFVPVIAVRKVVTKVFSGRLVQLSLVRHVDEQIRVRGDTIKVEVPLPCQRCAQVARHALQRRCA